jgi:hypothetical protein
MIASTPFAVWAVRSDPVMYPPALPPMMKKSASIEFSLPDIMGKYLGQFGKVTYSITSRSIVPNIPLGLTVTVEIPMFLTVERSNIAIFVRPNNAVVNGWPTINGTRQAEIIPWQSSKKSDITNDAWTGSEVVNFTSEGFVGGQVEILWVPTSGLWNVADWNTTDLKIQTSTSLVIESPQAVEARYQAAVSSAWVNAYGNAGLSVALFAGGIAAFLAGLLLKRAERRKPAQMNRL